MPRRSASGATGAALAVSGAARDDGVLRLVDASADGLIRVTADGRVVDANEVMCRMLGQPLAQLVGSAFADWFAERDDAARGIELTIGMGRVSDYFLTLATPEEGALPVSLNAAVLPGGEAEGILVSVRDITDQKELERQLRDAIDRNRSLIESNRDALLTLDYRGQITDVNRQTEALTGRGRAELTGAAFAALFAEHALAAELAESTLRDGTVSDVELTGVHSSGALTPVACNAAILRDAGGEPRGLIVTARDMTERKRLEQALRATNAELELANRGKDRFLAGMSHELRTPLNGIMGFTDILLAGMAGPLNEEQRGQLTIVQSSARHLLSIINDLLDLARIEERGLTDQLQPVACGETAREVAAGLAPLASGKGLTLRVECPDDDLLAVTDRRALTQILINLVNNAVKFTERGGARLVVGRREEAGKPFVAFDVIDTGPGITPEGRERLFLAFERLRRPGVAAIEGSGLGLHISRRLADHLGGTISFASEPGGGSRFTLLLPCAPPESSG
jgi:PAS domain S-box-containing protein